MTPSQIRQSNLDRQAKRDAAACRNYGFSPKQPEYRKCIVDEKRYRQTQDNIAASNRKPAPGSYEWQLERIQESLYE